MSTLVQIKRSSSNVSPTTLLEGELAYSFLSNTLFIGNTTNAVINIGGSYYTNKLDLASFANSASTLVLRAANGSSQFSQLDILVSPTANSHVATKQYVDGVISNAVFANATLAGLTDVSIGSAFANQSGKILIGNTSGYFVGRSVTGNVRISETGVFVIGASQVQNSMLNNSSVVINAGSGLIGGGTVSLGGSITLNVGNVENSMLNNSNITINAGSGLIGGGIVPLGGNVTLSVSNVENSMLNNSTVVINAGNGLSGGGTVSLGGNVTLNVSNVENSLLNNSTVTINAGDGLIGGGTVSLGNSLTIHVNAGDGISNSNDQVSVNNTVVRNDRSQTLNGTITFANTVNFNNGVNVTGNVNIQGNTTLINVTTLNVSDPLIYLAANNSINDIVDIGFLGGKNTAGFYSHTGLVRHAADGIWYLFDNLVEESAESNVVDVANTTYALLRANLEAKQLNVTGAGSYANISSLILGTPLLVGSGGTGLTSFTANGVLYANTSNSLNFATGTEGQTLQIKSGIPTFDNVAVVAPSNTFATINANGTLIVAGSNNDILKIIAGVGTFVTANGGNNTIIIGTQLNDTFTSSSTTQAATANVVNTIYSIANTAYTQSLAANLTVKEIVTSNNNQVINSYSSITTIQFDSDSGLAVIDESNNTVTIQLNSTFKFWQVNNNPGLIAVGLDTVNFITGYGIEISANNANTPKSITFSAPLIGTVYDSANNRVLRSGDTMTGDLIVNGTVAATTKSFIINHPSKPGMKLRYGSLEGPENGVYVRGILRGGNIIELPDYWLQLVDENSITVLLTPIKKYQKLYVKEIKDNKVFVGNSSLFGEINCSYIIYGERKDVEKLHVEY